MNDLTTTTPDAPIALAVQIDHRRAQLLWQTASPVAGFDLTHRFELVEGDDSSVLHEAAAWVNGMVMWCEGTLEAITLTAYETSNGFTAHLLWDLACGPNWSGGYAVLTSRPYRF